MSTKPIIKEEPASDERNVTGVSINAAAKVIHFIQKQNNEWNVIDHQDPLKRVMISPPLCDNRGKLIDLAIRLLTISKSEIPQNRDTNIVSIIYDLLDFAAAHNYDLEKLLQRIIDENE